MLAGNGANVPADKYVVAAGERLAVVLMRGKNEGAAGRVVGEYKAGMAKESL